MYCAIRLSASLLLFTEAVLASNLVPVYLGRAMRASADWFANSDRQDHSRRDFARIFRVSRLRLPPELLILARETVVLSFLFRVKDERSNWRATSAPIFAIFRESDTVEIERRVTLSVSRILSRIRGFVRLSRRRSNSWLDSSVASQMQKHRIL